MDTQEAFNIAVNHLLTQGKKSITPNGGCRYRGPDNTKCAIGCLIPDHLYNETMDSDIVTDIYNVLNNYPELKQYFQNVDFDLLLRLQKIHDSIPPKYWKEYLMDLTKEFSLEFNYDN